MNQQIAISLLLEDIKELNEKGKFSSDYHCALQLMQEDLKREYDSFVLASSLSNSNSVPLALINQFQNQDAMERRDREVALGLASKKDREKVSAVDQKFLQSFEGMSISKTKPEVPPVASSSNGSLSSFQHWSFSLPKSYDQKFDKTLFPCQVEKPVPENFIEITNRPEIVKNDQDRDEKPMACIACFGENQVKVACGHYYCNDCLKQLCLGAINDISFFPARCCKQVISQEMIQNALNETEYNRYKQKQTDISDLDVKKIDPEFHKMVTTMGWKVCPGCGAGIEKTQDCNHMTCIICKFEFCYVCNASFNPRTCKCDLWRPEELERILNEVAPRVTIVERNRLRDVYRNHDTHEHRWRKLDIVNSYKKCRNCHWVCNMWYWRCEGCSTNRCGKCAHNYN